MSDSDLPTYLRDDFDPSTATVAQLRLHLVEHNIAYPSNAKKSALVDIFNQRLVPQRGKIRARRDNARRSSRGIVDAASSQDTLPDVFGEDAPDLRPPRSSRRSRSPRKSTRVKSEEPDHLPVPLSPSKRATRSSSRQASLAPSHPADPEPLPLDDGLRSIRKTRHRTPDIKKEEPDDDPFRRVSGGQDSNFSDENPFQSGSSPAPAPKSAARRRTAGTDTVRIKSNTSRRRTDNIRDIPSVEQDDHQFDDLAAPVTPVSDFHNMDAGEEFTPEAQLELEQEQASKGEIAVARQKSKTRKGGVRLSTALRVLFTAIVSYCVLWYRRERIAVGYCGLGREATKTFPDNFPAPEWARAVLEPSCELCPPHAYCYEDFVAKCDSDYILKPHPLSFGGLIPLPPTCEPDGEKVRRIKIVADKAVEELRDRRAKFECGELVDDQGGKVDDPGMDEQELKETISKKRGKRMNNREFDELWEAAIGEITKRDEVEVAAVQTAGDSGSVPNRRLSSTSLARISLLCALKRSFRLSLARYRFYIGLVIVSALLILHLWSRYQANRAVQAQVPALVDMVLDRLAAQKDLGEEDLDDGWLFLPNLRDDVLRSIHSLAERDRIWKRVRAVVELNSNVRTVQREGRSGEIARAWEWIGPTPGNSESIQRRRSRRSGSGFGRTSISPDVKLEKDTPSGDGPRTYKRWEESRPIY